MIHILILILILMPAETLCGDWSSVLTQPTQNFSPGLEFLVLLLILMPDETLCSDSLVLTRGDAGLSAWT